MRSRWRHSAAVYRAQRHLPNPLSIRGSRKHQLFVNSANNTDAEDGGADLVLNIIAGDGYNIGTTQPTHEVALFNASDASFAATEDSNLEYGDGTTGEQVEVQLNLGERPNAAYRIRWSFTRSPLVIPLNFNALASAAGSTISTTTKPAFANPLCRRVWISSISSSIQRMIPLRRYFGGCR